MNGHEKLKMLQTGERVIKTVSVKKVTYERVESFMKKNRIKLFSPLFDIMLTEWLDDIEKKEEGISSKD